MSATSNSRPVNNNQRSSQNYIQEGANRMRQNAVFKRIQQQNRAQSAQKTNNNRQQSNHQNTSSNVDQGEMEQFRNDLKGGSNVSEIPAEKLQPLNSYLREYAQNCANNEDYDEAETTKSLADKVLQEYEKRSNDKNSKDRGTEEMGSVDMEEFDRRCKEELQQHDEETNQKVANLEKQHQKDKEDFEKKWSEEMPNKYRKPSQHLLQLKNIEKALANSGEYARAKSIHSEVEALQNQEQQQAQEALIRDYNFACRRLERQQAKAKDTLLASRAHTRTLLETRQETERQSALNRANVIKTRQNEAPRYRPVVTAATGTRSFSRSGEQSSGKNDILLPPLRPPNDPQLVEESRRKQREENKKKLAYQKKNAEMTLARVSLTPSETTSQENTAPSSKASSPTSSKAKSTDRFKPDINVVDNALEANGKDDTPEENNKESEEMPQEEQKEDKETQPEQNNGFSLSQAIEDKVEKMTDPDSKPEQDNENKDGNQQPQKPADDAVPLVNLLPPPNEK